MRHFPITTALLAKLRAEIPEGKRLHLMDKIVRQDLERARGATQRRLALHRQIAECAESLTLVHDSGLSYTADFVAVVESGMDCDGVQYSGKVRLVPADWRKVEAFVDHASYWADGPCNFAIVSPSAAESITYSSRDRTLEAFENGHPWSI